MFLTQLFIGTVLICITVVIHAVSLDFLIVRIESMKNRMRLAFKRYWKVPLLVFAVMGTFGAHIVQIWIWAMFYLAIGVMPDFEEALYFSTSSFTTGGMETYFWIKNGGL